jgi:hypothetical protein
MGPGTTAALAVLEEHLHEEAQIAAYQDTFLLLDVHFVNPVPVDCEDNNM